MFRTLACALVAVLLSVSSAFPANVTLKLGHIADPQNPYAQGAEKLAKLAKEKSGGTLEIQVYPLSRLGNQRDLIEGLAFGTVDMALVNTAIFSNFVPEMGVFDLPFIFRDLEHAHKTLDTLGLETARLGEARGIKTLALMENGIRHITNNLRPIREPADMRGLKIRVMEQPVYLEMMKLLGVSPIPMAFGEIYTALQKGVLDGQENSLAHIWTSRFFEVQKYVSLTAHTYSAELVLISMSAWKYLPLEQQQALQEAAAEATVWQRELCRKLEKEYIGNINSSIINGDVDLQAFAEAARPAWKIFADKQKRGQALINSVINIK